MSNRVKKVRDRIVRLASELRESNFYQIDFVNSLKKCLTKLGNDRKIQQIICYGLGSFSDGIDITSRYQLALLLLIHEFLVEYPGIDQIDTTIEIFDPSFHEADICTLESFQKPKFKLIKENEFCGRKLMSSKENFCALVYMPHLDKYLYNNLIGANWDVENLNHILILGNSFSEMIDKETSLICHRDLHYMNLLVTNFKSHDSGSSPHKRRKRKNSQSFKDRESGEDSVTDEEEALIEIPIDDSGFEHSDIFNSLSFQFINNSWLINNHKKIQQNHRANWTCVTSPASDDLS